jgi:hypothetical protein
MRILLAILLAVVASLPILAKPSEAEKKELEAWARSLDRETIHRAVLDHERDPLGEDAKKIRPVLVVHFEPVDYLICSEVASLAGSKDAATEAVMWQIVFSSGDWVELNPERRTDIQAYRIAGLESGLRAYENILQRKPKARSQKLDDLLKLRNEGRLAEYVSAHPCSKE